MLFALLASVCVASDDGRTGASESGCGNCHGKRADSTTTAEFATDSTDVTAGESVEITLTVSTSSTKHTAAGLDVSAEGGTLSAGSDTKVSRKEVTHRKPIKMTDQMAEIAFSWTAPTVNGTYALHAAGNAVNEDDEKSGDGWNLAEDLVFTVTGGTDPDSGAVDSGSDTGDSGGADTGTNPPAECACASTGARATWANWLAFGAMLGTVLVRRRVR